MILYSIFIIVNGTDVVYRKAKNFVLGRIFQTIAGRTIMDFRVQILEKRIKIILIYIKVLVKEIY